MKTFEEYLDETTFRSNHIRPPHVMAQLHKLNLCDSGHTVISHTVNGNGDHVIHHKSPNGRVRVSLVKAGNVSGRYRSRIVNKPATEQDTIVY